LDASDHDGFAAAVLFEGANPLADAEEADFVEFVAEWAKLVGLGLAGEGGTDDTVASGANATGGFEGKTAFASDEAQGRLGGNGRHESIVRSEKEIGN